MAGRHPQAEGRDVEGRGVGRRAGRRREGQREDIDTCRQGRNKSELRRKVRIPTI